MATGAAATVEGGERGGELAAAASFLNGRKGGGEGNNNNNNAGGGAGARGGRRKAQFLEVYQQLKKELLSDSDLFQYTTESRTWVEEASHTHKHTLHFFVLLPSVAWHQIHHRKKECITKA
jgi:hypothetical protein